MKEESADLLHYKPMVTFSKAQETLLLNYARDAIEACVAGSEPQLSLPSELAEAPAYGIFVTISRNGFLRACRGRWGGEEPSPMGDLLAAVAADSALNDPRFPRIENAELPFVELEISLMHSPKVFLGGDSSIVDEIVIGRDGLVILHPSGRGLLLPQVASEYQWTPTQFLEQTCRKAGLSRSSWRDRDVEVVRFSAEVLASPSPAVELDYNQITEDLLSALLKVANGVENSISVAKCDYPQATLLNAGEFGIELVNGRGARSLRFFANCSVVEGVVQMSKSANEGEPQASYQQISLLSVPIEVTCEDRLERTMALGLCAWRLIGPGREATAVADVASRDRLFTSLFRTAELEEAEWERGEVKVVTYRYSTYSKHDDGSRGVDFASSRSPAVAGRFYPADASALRSEVRAWLGAAEKIQPKRHDAIMLPHAGWRFCGRIIAQTLAQISVPERVIIVGPKHTRLGPRWSVASHHSWEFPGFEVPIDQEIVTYLANNASKLEVEPKAHLQEHGAEVLIPFLYELNPDIKITPIALGFSDFDECEVLVRSLSGAIGAYSPLLVISSDMNHFAAEEEGMRRDKLALRELTKGDPHSLYSICISEEISMCGVVPASTVMRALLARFRSLSVSITGYTTSAEVTGDRSSVVGYAGAVIDGVREGSIA